MSHHYKNIIIEKFDYHWQIWLNRPEKHNALNAQMIDEFSEACKDIDESKTRLVVLRGKGKSFCAGADLSWMKDASNLTFENNKKDAGQLAHLLYTIHNLPVPVIAIAHGAVYGGALGLLAACDFVFAEKKSIFSFSEVKLGLSPSTIMPYVLKRLSSTQAKELILTAKVINEEEALDYKLIDEIIEQNEVESIINSYLVKLKNAAPGAVSESKRLINLLTSNITEDTVKMTVESLANRRISDESLKGINAFLNKEKISWGE